MRKWSGRGLLYPLVFLLAALLWLAPLWREPAGFAFWRPAAFTDLLVSHFPNAELVRRSISTWGEIPLWNPTILSGAPFAADPLAGLFYPPFWLGILLPAGLGFNLIFLLHLAWAGWGASWLAGREGIGRAGRLTAGLLFAGTPKLIGHIGLGHLTFVAAIAWTPWILLLAGEAATAAREGSRGWIQRSAAAGAAWGLAFLADPRWLIPSGLAAGLYAIWGLLRDRLPARRETARAAGAAGAAAVFAAGIAAALALPLAEFASLSTRALLTDADRMAMQLPALRLVGVFVPEPGGWPEWLTYTGIVTLGLAAGALFAWRRSMRFWLLIAAIAWALALGDQTPAYAAFEAIVPGAGLLRVPARFLILAALALAMLAAHGMDGLVSSHAARRLPRELFGPLGLALAMAAAVVVASSAGPLQPGLLGAGALAAVAGIWALLAHWRARRFLAPGLILIAVVDLMWMGFSLLEVRDDGAALSEREAVAEEVAGGADGERSFSPSYSIPQQTAAIQGLELADGVNPLQLRGYVAAMGQATGFNSPAYSVTLPPFPAEGPRGEWEPQLDLGRLGLLSVGLIVSDFPLVSEGLESAGVVDGVHIYRNPQVLHRAWVQREGGEPRGEWAPVRSWEWSPNRIVVEAEGPGLLVFSEVVYPGWRAEIDGERGTLESAYGVLRAVQLPEGRHAVVLEYRPWRVGAGIAISLLTVIGLAVLWIRR